MKLRVKILLAILSFVATIALAQVTTQSTLSRDDWTKLPMHNRSNDVYITSFYATTVDNREIPCVVVGGMIYRGGGLSITCDWNVE